MSKDDVPDIVKESAKRLSNYVAGRHDDPVTDEPETLDGIISQCLADSKAWFPDIFRDDHATIVHQTLAMCGEVGEAANILKKIDRGTKTWIDGSGEKFDEELIDVFIYLCNLFGLRDVDPIALYNAKRQANLGRFA